MYILIVIHNLFGGVLLGLHCYAGFSPAVASGGYSLAVVCRLLITVASFVVEHGL